MEEIDIPEKYKGNLIKIYNILIHNVYDIINILFL